MQFEYDPATLRATRAETARRVVVDENRVLIERQDLARLEDVQTKCADALIAATRYAREAREEAYFGPRTGGGSMRHRARSGTVARIESVR